MIEAEKIASQVNGTLIGDRNLVIVGAYDIIPGKKGYMSFLDDNSDVKKFCEIRFGVNFPMTSIQKIRGDNAHPLYKWISSSVSIIAQPRWNFHKYLISKDGKIINLYSSMTSPTSETLIREVEDAISN